MTDQEIFRKLAELKESGANVCLATIVQTLGSTPRDVGAKMLICADGTRFGSVGGGCGEMSVQSAAQSCLYITHEPELLEVDLDDAPAIWGRDVCGGKMWVFVEPHEAASPKDRDSQD